MIEMKNGTGVLIFIILTCVITAKANNQDLITNKKDTVMSKIQFIPKEFHDVVCDFQNGMGNPCTPKEVRYSIRINAPKEVILYVNKGYNANLNTAYLQLPICIEASITDRRRYKYLDLTTWVINVRKAGSDKWQINKLEIDDYDEMEEGDPFIEIEKREELEKQKDAQKYSDDELDVLPGNGYTFNIDPVKHSGVVFEEGEYEIFLSCCGLDSNSVIVKITFKETEE